MTPLMLRLRDVEARTGLKKSLLYRLVQQGRFPAPIKIGAVSVWRVADLENWAASLPTQGAA